MPTSVPEFVPPRIVAARGDQLVAGDGREFFDFSMGYGTVWLGHGHPAIVAAVQAQLASYAAPGFLPCDALDAATAALQASLPETHRLGGYYSTGMEAMETALRAARVHTGRRDCAGFAGSTHGRSAYTAALGGEGGDLPLPHAHRLPSLAAPVAVLEAALRELLDRVPLAALIVEPVQMTGGGHALDRATAARLVALARERGVLVVFDETLTALHRCGPALFADSMAVTPDILVLGKGLANGLPAAAVTVAGHVGWDRARVKPGSTFYNHPVACAAIAATLRELARLDAPARVARIEAIVRAELGALDLRGCGALWTLALPDVDRQAEFVARLNAAGVIASYYAGHVRLMPAVTVDEAALAQACRAVREAHDSTYR